MATVAVTDATFDAEVRQSDVPVVVDFWAEWCGPCKKLEPIVHELAGGDKQTENMGGLIDYGPGEALVPAWLGELIREDPDGAWIALRLRLSPSTWPDGPPAELVSRIKQAAPGAAIASAVALGAELRTVATDVTTELWGPNPMTPQPVRPSD